MDVVTASRALAVLFMGYVVAWPLRHADRVTDLRINHLIPEIGHWTQQEAPEEVNRLMLEFLEGVKS